MTTIVNPGKRLIRILRMLMLAAIVVMTAESAAAFTVVIDPGHGGHDHGAIGESISEKEINLAVAKRLGKLIKENIKDAKVVYTRDKDVFITLQGRCDIANRAKGDIFVSIHTNSVAATSPNRKKVCGASVYTLGLNRAGTNLDVAMRENSVMKLEDDYSTTYSGFDPSSTESYIIFELSQSAHIDQSLRLAKEIQQELVATASRKDLGVRQAPFWVLVRSAMPAVLVELDFVCNPTVEKYLGSDNGRDHLAKAIFNGINAYHSCVERIAKTASKPAKETKGRKEKKPDTDKKATSEKSKEPTTPDNSTIIYKVQFLTAPREIPEGDRRLRGLKGVESYLDGGLVKFTVGSYTSLPEAQKHLKEVKKQFPDAFIIKTRGGKRIK